jgi:hypothetical protein
MVEDIKNKKFPYRQTYIQIIKYTNMNNDEVIKVQQELIKLLYTQVIDLTMMSKIELGDDVIEEITRLRKILNQNNLDMYEQY